jgi:hypothetical protein
MGPLIISFLFSHIFGNRDGTVCCGELVTSIPLQRYMHNDRVHAQGHVWAEKSFCSLPHFQQQDFAIK